MPQIAMSVYSLFVRPTVSRDRVRYKDTVSFVASLAALGSSTFRIDLRCGAILSSAEAIHQLLHRQWRIALRSIIDQ